MQQLTIYCSTDLAEKVIHVLRQHDLEGYIQLPGLFGNKIRPKGSFEKDLVWSAEAFVAFPSDEQLRAIIDELKVYRKDCGEELCLRMVVHTTDEVI